MSFEGRLLKPWLYVATLFASQLVALAVVVVCWELFIKFRYWVGTPFGTFSVTVLSGLAAFSVVIFFSHPKSLPGLLRPFEFESLREGVSYFVLVAGFVLGLIGVFITRINPANFADKYPLAKPFIHQPGPEKYLLVVLFLVGPVLEEIIMRGFLYRTFRQCYGITLSISIMVLVATLTHWGVMTASPWMFLLIAALQIILCLVLEKTRNLWNCIACHFAYNAAVTSAWLLETSR